MGGMGTLMMLCTISSSAPLPGKNSYPAPSDDDEGEEDDDDAAVVVVAWVEEDEDDDEEELAA